MWWVVTLTGVLLVVLFVAVTRQILAARRASANSGPASVAVGDLGSPQSSDVGDTDPTPEPERPSAERDLDGEPPATIVEPRRAPLEQEPLGSDSALASLDSARMLGGHPRTASGQVQMPLPRTAADDAEPVVPEMQTLAAVPVVAEEPVEEPAAVPVVAEEPVEEPAAMEEPAGGSGEVEEPAEKQVASDEAAPEALAVTEPDDPPAAAAGS